MSRASGASRELDSGASYLDRGIAISWLGTVRIRAQSDLLRTNWGDRGGRGESKKDAGR